MSQLAPLPHAQSNFTWVLLPARPFTASDGVSPAPEPALALPGVQPSIGPSNHGSLVPAHRPVSVPNGSEAVAACSSEVSDASTDSDCDSDSPLSRHRGSRTGRVPPSGAACGRRPTGTAGDCFAALDGMGTLPLSLSDSPGESVISASDSGSHRLTMQSFFERASLPTSHAGFGRAAPAVHTFGLLPGQAQLLAPLLILSPPTATKGVPATVQHESAQPRRAPRRPAPQRFVSKLTMAAAPATQQPLRQAVRKGGRKGQAAASQGAKSLAALEPAARKRKSAGAPPAGQRGAKQAAGASRIQKAAQAAGSSAGTSMPPRRRAGRKSAVPRKAEAEGHRVVALPEEEAHCEAQGGWRATGARQTAAKPPAGPAVQPRKPAKGTAGRKKVGCVCTHFLHWTASNALESRE